MNLTDSQKQQVAAWLEAGLKLSDVQNKLAAELGVNLTYMEVKFLLADLQLKPKDQERPKEPAPILPAPAGPAAPTDGMDDEPLPTELAPEPPAPGAQEVTLTVDQVTRAGAMVSGKVTFSDGMTGEWYLDQTGRLGLTPKQPGYRPPQADVMIFQTKLQAALAQSGF
ncbi:MAG: hypothetical protein HY301_20365 [Verrucomicrobia bacterium]|nr:hypothetical protein [Verrucomicrobiota bacterium]